MNLADMLPQTASSGSTLDQLLAFLHNIGNVKQTLGQDGAAGQMNGNARDAYNQYAEGEMVAGRQPMPYPQWYATQSQQAQP